ncbi:MAG: arginine--tRNA ligase [Flavobacteriia bacterium]|nr:arginine--tRNA ligase [Flavobacteriia bacterium]OJX37073.1 MAG: arginine--tRNA ligase [Flavobacteriia bacterium 40-80]
MEEQIKKVLLENSQELFGEQIEEKLIQFQQTRREFEGDVTLVTFPFSKILKSKPEEVAGKIGAFLKERMASVKSYNVIQGFLNIVIEDDFWINQLNGIAKESQFGYSEPNSKSLKMVEYSSPNTNKPLHLGHLRNIFLGYSVSEILKANGHKVIKTQIINDRGIHICKSMLAWERFSPVNQKGERETPQNTGIKGDKLVGKYYVEFDIHFNNEAKEIIAQWEAGRFDGFPKEVTAEYQKLEKAKAEKSDDEKAVKEINAKIKDLAKNQTTILRDAKEMLVKWEARDPQVYLLWTTMNGWVYDGFEATYQTMEVDFDKLYYESDTFILGRDVVLEGLEKGVFYRKEDGSVWIDLTADGMDEKLLLRSDGTSVYMTQDIGTAIERFRDYPDLDGIIYTVANEQDYHFKVLFLILDKLGYDWAKKCYHLSYGMVDLPTGRMKSREGTVVDADDLMAEMIGEADKMTAERGHLEGLTKEQIAELNHTIGIGGLKYYLLKIDPKKRMMFNPLESVELNGHTAPFVQYGYARIQSLLRKAKSENIALTAVTKLETEDINLIKSLSRFRNVIDEAANSYSPSLVVNYCFELTKEFNSYYQSINILKEENEALRASRLILCENIGKVIRLGMQLLGIKVPERM